MTVREDAAPRRPRELAAPGGIAGLRREIAALGGFSGRRGAKRAAPSTAPRTAPRRSS